MHQDTPQIAVDPNLAAEQAQAQANLTASMQNQAQIDTATIMARYGTKLALGANDAASPMSQPGAGIRF